VKNKKSHKKIGVSGIPIYEPHRPPKIDNVRLNIKI